MQSYSLTYNHLVCIFSIINANESLQSDHSSRCGVFKKGRAYETPAPCSRDFRRVFCKNGGGSWVVRSNLLCIKSTRRARKRAHPLNHFLLFFFFSFLRRLCFNFLRQIIFSVYLCLICNIYKYKLKLS